MNTKKYFKNIFLWVIPAILLLLSLFSMPFPLLYSSILQIVVSLAGTYIAYLLFSEKPKYYLIWAITFVLIVLIYNPLIKLTIMMGVSVPLNLITALIFLANGLFVFKFKELS